MLINNFISYRYLLIVKFDLYNKKYLLKNYASYIKTSGW